MLHDHAEGRNYVKGMAEKILLYKQGETTALKVIYSNMLAYADLLKNHIEKENKVLFRMADNAFTPAEQESLILDFTKVEYKRESGKSKNDYVLMIDNLAGIYVI